MWGKWGSEGKTWGLKRKRWVLWGGGRIGVCEEEMGFVREKEASVGEIGVCEGNQWVLWGKLGSCEGKSRAVKRKKGLLWGKWGCTRENKGVCEGNLGGFRGEMGGGWSAKQRFPHRLRLL